MPTSRRLLRFVATAALVFADSTPQTIPFSQNWSNSGLITANDNWSGVPGIQGFLGQDLTTSTGTDPRTILTGSSSVANDLDVIANQSNPNITNGGVAEFDGIANPTIALQGSGTADAAHLILTLNTTGQNNVVVSYNLRDIDASSDNAIQPVALQYRVGTSGNFTNLDAGYVADATEGPSLAAKVTPVSATLPSAADNQPVVQIRILTTNAAGNDEWVGVDDISVSTSSASPSLSINDVQVLEGNSGTTTALFTVSLSSPAGAGGVNFDIATANSTASTADNDFVFASGTAQTIPAGGTSYSFAVAVNGDTTPEASEVFFVNVTNVTGATVADAQGIGTITNDDVTIIQIHDIQGNGITSPIPGAIVTTRGIVTGVRSNGFYLQTPDAEVDADPNTSQGIFVFTSTAPPLAASVGNLVLVSGTVTEFFPNADAQPLTELVSPTIVQLSTGNPLPAPVPLSPLFPWPAGSLGQLERVEGMRVSIPSLTVTQPTEGIINEPNASATSTGLFYGVVTGAALPFREPGIASYLISPTCAAGFGCAIPVWDANPEVVAVDSNRLTGAPILDLAAKSTVTGLVGVLDVFGKGYIVFPDPSATISVTPAPAFPAAPVPTSGEVTVAAANLRRLFDDGNDPSIGEPVLTTTALDRRLAKLSLYVRERLRSPDVIAVSEVENLSTLQRVAAKINSDTIAGGGASPMYTAFLVEGNDVGGIDVGFLIKSQTTTVTEMVQHGAALTFVNPENGLPEQVFDRPPLRFTGITTKTGQQVPFTVFANHLRSLNGVETEARVRAKRKAQAEALADMVQARQSANSSEMIAVTGDLNAFEFNDGYVDVVGTILGNPTAPTQVVLASADLVTPNLRHVIEKIPQDQHYSYRFEGNAQILDHALLSQPMFNRLTRAQFVRGNADAPENDSNSGAIPERISDHDAILFAISSAQELTSGLTLTRGPIGFNATAGTYQFGISVRNTTANPITGPLQVVLSGFPSGITPTNATTQNALGYVYTIPNGLAANGSAVVTIRYTNSSQAVLSFASRVFQGSF